LSIYLGRIGVATIIQIFGCFVHGVTVIMQMGIGMAFTSQNFWENLANSPFIALEFFTFLGYLGVAVALLILEYLRYNARKNQETNP
jgi:hypothetical protein